ncbi:hypothetical protein OG896_13125 [Streptomyces sp. NBC_00669]|uniref:hypothetical protein n=1 Tax=Streptomyces sp. NBC_00669 TaxID=2976011 RepID=UPI002E356F15|nr:hypothetical protein [Streptomyces sp. NBC_00669]
MPSRSSTDANPSRATTRKCGSPLSPGASTTWRSGEGPPPGPADATAAASRSAAPGSPSAATLTVAGADASADSTTG